MTHKDYDEDELIGILNEFQSKYPHLQLILEPGSAFTWDTGCLVATVEDKVSNGGINTMLLNVSFACHMPDCLEMPYKPVILDAHEPEEGTHPSIGIWNPQEGFRLVRKFGYEDYKSRMS